MLFHVMPWDIRNTEFLIIFYDTNTLLYAFAKHSVIVD